MNQSQAQFLRAVALRTPYSFSETGNLYEVRLNDGSRAILRPYAPRDTGDAATDTAPTYPPPPTFSVNELLPALRSERAKVGWIGFGAGLALAAGGYAIFRSARRRSSRK